MLIRNAALAKWRFPTASRKSAPLRPQAREPANRYILLRSVVVDPVVMELLFRGALFRRWRRRFGPVMAAVASRVVFGALRATPTDAAVRGFGMVLPHVRAKSRWAPIAASVDAPPGWRESTFGSVLLAAMENTCSTAAHFARAPAR